MDPDRPVRLAFARSRAAATLAACTLAATLVGCAAQRLPEWAIGPFVRCTGGPILAPRGQAWEAKAVFNPAAIAHEGKLYLLYRAEDHTGQGEWNGTSRIGLAVSDDGIHFKRRDKPVIEATESYEWPGGCEDPRIVRINDMFYLTYTGYDGQTARLCLATSRDLVNWRKHGPVFPHLGWTKAGAILTEPVHGKYIMYFGNEKVSIAYSDDLLSWHTEHKTVLPVRSDKYFDSLVVEPGPPPLLTPQGILLIYNAVDKRHRFAAGQALFDRSDPERIIARLDRPFLAPRTDYERRGQTPNVVFLEGLVRWNRQWILYYGAADSYAAAAYATDQD